MEAAVIDTVAEGIQVIIPEMFRNKRLKIVIIDPEEEYNLKGAVKKMYFKIDETLEDAVPFADIEDTKQFAKELKEKHWR